MGKSSGTNARIACEPGPTRRQFLKLAGVASATALAASAALRVAHAGVIDGINDVDRGIVDVIASRRKGLPANYQASPASGLEARTIKYNRSVDDGYAVVQWGPDLFGHAGTEYDKGLTTVAAGLCAAAGSWDGDSREKDWYIMEALNALGFDDIDTMLVSYPDGEGDGHGYVEHRYFYRGEEPVEKSAWESDRRFIERLGIKKHDSLVELDGQLYLRRAIVDEHCFAIARQTMGRGDDRFDLIAIVMRGTESGDEALGDATATADRDFNVYKVHDYFADYADKVKTAMKRFVSQHPAASSRTKMLVCGHSLGGAAANLFGASIDIEIAQGKTMWGVDRLDDVYTFTFGALNSFDRSYGTRVREAPFDNIFNVFNELDTFGPEGKGAVDVDYEAEDPFGAPLYNIFAPIINGATGGVDRPANGSRTFQYKFGHICGFRHDYTPEFDGIGKSREKHYDNHIMAGYFRAVRDDLIGMAGSGETGDGAGASAGPWSAAYERFVLDGGYLESGQTYHTANDQGWVYVTFALYDMDADGTPELIAYNGCEYESEAYRYAYRFDGAGVVYAGTVGARRTSDIWCCDDPDYPGLFHSASWWGQTLGCYYALVDGEAVEEEVLLRDYARDENGEGILDENGEPVRVETRLTDDERLFEAYKQPSGFPQERSVDEIRAMGWPSFVAEAGWA